MICDEYDIQTWILKYFQVVYVCYFFIQTECPISSFDS